MTEKTVQEQIEELDKLIDRKNDDLESLSLGTNGSGVFDKELAAFLECGAELDALYAQRRTLTAASRGTRPHY